MHVAMQLNTRNDEGNCFSVIVILNFRICYVLFLLSLHMNNIEFCVIVLHSIPIFLASCLSRPRINAGRRDSGLDDMTRSWLTDRRILMSYEFQLACDLISSNVRMSLGLRFCASRKGETMGEFQSWAHITKWVWFESQMCTGWLQWLLCQVRSFKTHLKWKCGVFRGSIGLK